MALSVNARVRIPAVLLYVTLFAGCSRPSAYAEPPVSPLAALEKQQISISLQKQTPAQIIEALSLKLGRGILVDGEPKGEAIYLETSGSAKQVLDKVADQLDCTWTLGKRGVILLRKRFRDRDDKPQMHLKEMQKMARDILAIWPADTCNVRFWFYPFDYQLLYPANALYRTLTPDQRQALSAGQTLAYDTLAPDQQSLVRLGIYNQVVHNSRDIWQRMNDRLLGMDGKGYLIWRPTNPQKPDRKRLDYVWDPTVPMRSYVKLAGERQLDDEQKRLDDEQKKEDKP